MKAFVFALAGICLTNFCLKSSAQTSTVEGSVFVVMKNGASVKLALAPVYVLSEARFSEISQKVIPVIDGVNIDLASKYFNADGDPKRRLAILKVEKTLREETYFDAFPAPITKSDADGKFTVKFDDLNPKIIACRAQRELVDDTEKYFWVIKFQPTGKSEQIMFCNDNTTAEKNIFPNQTHDFMDEIGKLEQERKKVEQERQSKNVEEYSKRYELRLAQGAAAIKAQQNKRNQSRAKALAQNQSLADKGDAYGQFRMGERYRDSDGVEKDEGKAREYFTKAAAQGHSDAAKALEKLKERAKTNGERP